MQQVSKIYFDDYGKARLISGGKLTKKPPTEEQIKSFIDCSGKLCSLPAAQSSYSTKSIFGSAVVFALAAASYVYCQVLANILHTLCVAIASNPVVSTLLLAAAVAGVVYYCRTTPKNEAKCNNFAYQEGKDTSRSSSSKNQDNSATKPKGKKKVRFSIP